LRVLSASWYQSNLGSWRLIPQGCCAKAASVGDPKFMEKMMDVFGKKKESTITTMGTAEREEEFKIDG
jgi:hypothetical protein